MLVQSPVAGDARVLREARTLAEAGNEVVVVGRGVPDPAPSLPGVRVLDAGRSGGLGSAGAGTRRGPLHAARRLARWALLPEHRARVEAAWRASAAATVAPLDVDVVHAHDRNTLELGARLADARGVPLVYDAHELWSDRGLPGRPTPLADRRQTRRESAWAGRAAAVLTVSDGIAEVLRGRGLRHVHVVRNSFPVIDPPPSTPPARPDRLLYAGRIGPGRDLETLVAVAGRPGAPGVTLVGPEDTAYASRLVVPGGVQRLPAVPIDDLDRLYVECGIAAVTLTARSRNHQLALPNKLFHAARAGVPVVAADLPEIRRVVSAHAIGELYRPGDADSLAAAAARLTERYDEALDAVRAARDALSWRRDGDVLLEVYRGLAA